MANKKATIPVFSALNNVTCLFNLRDTGKVVLYHIGICLAYATVTCEAVTLYCNTKRLGWRSRSMPP